MAIQKDYVINRKQYLDIKKKDHNQMNQFLLGIKGLGAKRVETIIKTLEDSFEK